MNQYPNLALTLGLACLLIPPFVLKTFHPPLEPYPAIILPGGSDTISIENSTVNFKKTTVLGKQNNQTQSWSKIDTEKLIEPIPVHYLQYMALTSFGFRSEPKKAGSIWKQKYDSFMSNKITAEEIVETKNWLKQKLTKLGYVADEFMVISEEITFDINTGKIVSRTKTDEKAFKLD